MSYSAKLSQQGRNLLQLLNNPVPQPRVGQLDASILDGELVELLKTQLWKVFKSFRPDIKDNYESELLLLLKLLVFKLTVWDHSATYGAKLQNLKFVDGRVPSSMSRPLSREQKLGYALLVVGGDFLWGKLERYISTVGFDGEHDYDGRTARIAAQLRKLSDALSSLWSISSLANFLLFLYTGRYSTLILRLLRIRLIPASRTLTRQVNFEFQNRQLVWNAFTEFLLFIVPILNIPKLKRRATKLISQGFSGKADFSGGNSGQGELYFLPEKTCAICYKGTDSTGQTNGSTSNISRHTEVTNPYETVECHHIYCYICITNKLLEAGEDGWSCVRCNTLVFKAKQFVQINPKAISISPLVMKDKESSENFQILPDTSDFKTRDVGFNDSENESEKEEDDISRDKHNESDTEEGEAEDEGEDVSDSVESDEIGIHDDEDSDYDIEEDELGGSGFVVADEEF